MVETRHFLPPETGPRSDPLLYGVAEALARLFPVVEGDRQERDARASAECKPTDSDVSRQEASAAA